ncbi:MAG: peptidoglycan DD-metalloendopeptidase family protein [Halioglobus sp.]
MRRWILYSVIAICLAACGGNDYRAPVEDRNTQAKSAAPSTYRVQKGDTLFSIAWRYGLDFRAVASNNRIAAPYTIYPGQKIYLAAKAPAPKQASKPVAKTSQSGTNGSSKPTSSPVAKTAAPKSSTKTTSSSASGAPVSSWRWPTSGNVTRGYSSTVHKGIDIEGKKGDPIYAVAAGSVVYAGTGIVGYGELLIVKHNTIYLSAYGHNSRLLVAEGDTVRAGQKIAEKGSSGTDTVKLHFEIRKEGKPIDPKRLLPRK